MSPGRARPSSRSLRGRRTFRKARDARPSTALAFRRRASAKRARSRRTWWEPAERCSIRGGIQGRRRDSWLVTVYSHLYNRTMTDPTRRRTFVRTLAAGLSALSAGPASADVALAGDTYVDPRRVLLWESTRKEFREAIEGGALKAVIVPTGSTEQHNEHLAMINDTASVTLVAQQAALLVYPQVTVATPVSIGISPHWMDRKGTLSLKKDTFLAVVFDICESLRTHGVSNILVLNGHGGNVGPLRQAVPEFAQKLGIRIETNSYWDAYNPEIVKKYMVSGKAPGHA